MWTPRRARRGSTFTSWTSRAGRWCSATAPAAGWRRGTCVAVTEAARADGISVALVEQPYRVAGRRSPAPAPRLDAAWTAVVGDLVARELRGLPLVVGGRSSGARVACRTAEATGAVGVICLAFPLQPPARAGPGRRRAACPSSRGWGSRC